MKLRVSELPPGRLLTVEPQTNLADVARVMRREDADAVVVLSDGELAGIITERDLVRAIADGVNPKQATAGVVMTGDPATVALDEDVSVVALKMMSRGVRHLPVVDGDGKPIGLVSARNLVAVLDRARS
ncbi:MAG: CBS domain-containing protein [Chloroflexi bacterium]|nr:MAG: CBS domain-containing protein [Chloroflexota bacterium]TMF37839.1 MAG: CBS domain-containing protein [Chloroflexota bacterium]